MMKDETSGAAQAAPSLAQQYRRFVFKRIFRLCVFLTAVIVSFVTNVIMGPAMLSFWDVVNGILDRETLSGAMQVIVFDVRLPFAVVAVIVGAPLGPNGVGKSSFLRTFAGLAKYDGFITYYGAENRKLSHNERARKVAYLPHPTNLVAYEAIISACRAVRPDLMRSDVDQLTERVFERLNISHIALQPFSRMSGGQRQMVGLAQITVREPDIMLLDEPISALDLRWQLGALDVVKNLVNDKQGLALIALHDFNLAMRHCDHLILFGEGGVLSYGSPQIAMTPEMLMRAYQVESRIETCSQGFPFIIVDELGQSTSNPHSIPQGA